MVKAKLIPLPESTCIEYAKFAPKAKKLLVKFVGYEAKYIYVDVELDLVKQWVKHSKDGGSVGAFFITQIKAKHSFVKIEPKPVVDEWEGVSYESTADN